MILENFGSNQVTLATIFGLSSAIFRNRREFSTNLRQSFELLEFFETFG